MQLVAKKGKKLGDSMLTIDTDESNAENIEFKIGLKYDHLAYIIYDNLSEAANLIKLEGLNLPKLTIIKTFSTLINSNKDELKVLAYGSTGSA